MKKLLAATKLFMLSTLISSLAHASGPNEITKLEIRETDASHVQVCIKTYGGWSETNWICSAAVATNDTDLASVKNLVRNFKAPVVDYLKDGFSIKALSDSLTTKNCELTSPAQARAAQIKQKIRALQAELNELDRTASNHQCQ